MKPLGYDTHYMNAVTRLQKAEKIAKKMQCTIYLGFSGGKDSQVLFHLADSINVQFVAMHFLTTIEPPELVRFIRRFYPSVQTVRQPLSMGRLIVKKKTLPMRNIRYCCDYYKELKFPNSVVLTGIRREESMRRAQRNDFEIGSRNKERRESLSFADLDDGQIEDIVSCIQGKDQVIINPIIDWSQQDVEYYLKEVLGVPKCELYKEGFQRMGCICCPMKGYKEKAQDVKRYPKYRDMFIRTIHRLRQECNYMSEHPELSDAQIFEWWISSVSLQKWIADNVTQGFLF